MSIDDLPEEMRTFIYYEMAAGGWWLRFVPEWEWLESRVARWYVWKVNRKRAAFAEIRQLTRELETRERWQEAMKER